MTSFASTAQAFMEMQVGTERQQVSSSYMDDDLVSVNEEGKIAIRWEQLVPNRPYPVEAFGKLNIIIRRPDDLIQIYELD